MSSTFTTFNIHNFISKGCLGKRVWNDVGKCDSLLRAV